MAPGLALPRLLWPTEIAGSVTEEAAAATGLRPGTPVTAGTVDAWAESVSAGVRDTGDTMVMYGTTMFLVQVTEAPARHRNLWSTRGVPAGSFTTAAGMATSGAITAWLRDLTGRGLRGARRGRRGRRRPGAADCCSCPTSRASGRRSSIPTPAASSSA